MEAEKEAQRLWEGDSFLPSQFSASVYRDQNGCLKVPSAVACLPVPCIRPSFLVGRDRCRTAGDDIIASCWAQWHPLPCVNRGIRGHSSGSGRSGGVEVLRAGVNGGVC